MKLKFNFCAMIGCLIFLAGCSHAIPAAEMMPNPNIYNQVRKSALKNNISIGTITISEKAPKIGFIVTDEELSKTFADAFKKVGWLSSKNNPKYEFSANFVKFEQPITMFNTKVFSIVDYRLVNKGNDKAVYSETIKIPCVKGMGEIFDGALRKIETTKCSIRENVTHVIRDLNSKF